MESETESDLCVIAVCGNLIRSHKLVRLMV